MDNLADHTLEKFFAGIENDPRISMTHIAVYMVLFQTWKASGYSSTFGISSPQIMVKSKIASSGTYHKAIRALHEFGYIRYSPSYNINKQSTVSLCEYSTLN